jgi:uncharacterized Fe-S cluster protein YjdI
MKIKKEYTRGDLTVVWQPHLCIHSGVCFRSLPGVFKPRERPWIQLEASHDQAIIDTVNACPSGALSLRHTEVEEVKVVSDTINWQKSPRAQKRSTPDQRSMPGDTLRRYYCGKTFWSFALSLRRF